MTTTTTTIRIQTEDARTDPLTSIRRAIQLADDLVDIGAIVRVDGELFLRILLPPLDPDRADDDAGYRPGP